MWSNSRSSAVGSSAFCSWTGKRKRGVSGRKTRRKGQRDVRARLVGFSNVMPTSFESHRQKLHVKKYGGSPTLAAAVLRGMLGSGSDATTERVWSHWEHWKQLRAHLPSKRGLARSVWFKGDEEERTGSSRLVRSRWELRRGSWGSSSRRSLCWRTSRIGWRRSPHRREGPRGSGAGGRREGRARAEGGFGRTRRCRCSGTAPRESSSRVRRKLVEREMRVEPKDGERWQGERGAD